MNEMVERVARAINEKIDGELNEKYLQIAARAAIAAMREDILEAVAGGASQAAYINVRQLFDAALEIRNEIRTDENTEGAK